MGSLVGRRVTEEVISLKRDRRRLTEPATDIWSEMQTLAREELLLSLETLEILQERLFRTIEQCHPPH